MASNISIKGAVKLSFASLRNDSSVSSVVTSKLLVSGFSDRVISVACKTFDVFSKTLLPDLKK